MDLPKKAVATDVTTPQGEFIQGSTTSHILVKTTESFNKSSDSSTAVTPEAPKISSSTEKLAKDFVSTLNKVDVQQNSSLKVSSIFFTDSLSCFGRQIKIKE